MSIKRITISVSSDLAGRIRNAADKTPVSACVSDIIEDRLNDTELERQWQQFYQDLNPSRQDVRRAETILKRLTKRPARRGAA
jgi:hypothetical protein